MNRTLRAGISLLVGLSTAIAVAGLTAIPAQAAVSTDQSDYSPGSVVTISGDNSDGAGYLAGETIHVDVTGPNGYASSCEGVADDSGAWSCQITLASDDSAVGHYSYTATGQTSGVSQSGTFTDACPNLQGFNNGGFQQSNLVGASFTTSGNDATYVFDSLVDRSPINGVPGLISYCVYSPTTPDSATATATGANSTAFNASIDTADHFDFTRGDGNPSNIPLDGTTGIQMGTATWSSGAPSTQSILLHINDAAECDRLYGGNPGTCFVLPGSAAPPAAGPLTISKTAGGSFDKTFKWTITKVACKDGTGFATGKTCVQTVKKVGGGTATFNYAVSVSHDDGKVSNVKVEGIITVTNPNSANVAIGGVTDQLSDGTNCTVTGGGSQSLAPGDTTFNYGCSLGSVPSSPVTNKATVSWSTQDLSDGSHLVGSSADTGNVAVSFTENDIDECVTVNDTNSAGPQNQTVCVGDANPTTFSYSVNVTVPTFDCVSYDNTATFTTNDTLATGSAKQTVTVCGPAKTGALTIGFWKQTNGQNLIKTYCINGGNNLGTYLAGLGSGSGPFSDAAGKNCSDLAAYVYNILNKASATNMNTMLKAQMLGTALDVWFSGPGWTSSKIGSIKPPSNFLSHNFLGTFKMDTTAICPMVDNLNTGTATCQNNTPSTNAVTAGALPSSPMSMQVILDYASTLGTSPWATGAFTGTAAASTWYVGAPETAASSRVKQEILKNVFDQFNNQLAFGSF